MAEELRQEIEHRNKTNKGWGKWVVKPECGEMERDTGRSVEALAARLPRMLSDSRRLMTGRAVATVKVREREQASAQGRPLSLGQTKRAAQPAPPSRPIQPSIYPSVHSFRFSVQRNNMETV